MLCIQLIVMGDHEQAALAGAFRAFWPAERHGQPVVWAKPIKMHEPASAALSDLKPSQRPSGAMLKLADRILQSARYPVRPGDPVPSLVLAVGDVELNNLGHEPLIAAHMRAALEHVVAARPTAEHAECWATLRKRCSYHLFRPMIESIFFGDLPTLCQVAGVTHTPKLKEPDVEEFEAIDPHPKWRGHCERENGRIDHRSGWRHERHAKDYLDFLLKLSGNRRGYNWRDQGQRVLEALDWRKVPSNERATPYLRAMFADIAAWYQVPSPLGPALRGPVTANLDTEHALLRNL